MRIADFQEVGMQNYGPYIEPMVLEFKPDSLVLITGPNGIGKTMALDAIPFTLYGVTSKGAKGDDVVNNVVGRNCKTWVKFTIDGVQYMVTRYHQYSKLGNTVILNVGGVDTKQGAKEVLPEIERILCPKKTFMNTLMFGQKVKDFFTDLGDADKKEIFRMILNLALYLMYYKKADEKLKKINIELDSLNTEVGIQTGLWENSKSEIEMLLQQQKYFKSEKETQLKDLLEDLKINETLLKQWQKDIEESQLIDLNTAGVIKEISNLESQLKESQFHKESEIRDLTSRKDLKEADIKSQVEVEKSKIKEDIRNTSDNLKQQAQNLIDKITELVQITQEKRHHVEISIEKLEGENRFYEEQATEIDQKVIQADTKRCPLCKQTVDGATARQLQETIEKFKSQIETNQISMNDMTQSIKRMNKILFTQSEEINSERDHLINQIQVLELDEKKKLKEIDVRLYDAQKKLTELLISGSNEIDKKYKEKEMQLTSKINHLLNEKEKMEEDQNKINQMKQAMEKVVDRITQCKIKIDLKENEKYDQSQLNFYKKKEYDLGAEIVSLQNRQEEVMKKHYIISFWKTGYSSSGIPSMLIDDSIPFMNERVAYYLEKLTNGRYIVSFDTLAETKAGDFRDKISVNVLDTFTRANSRVQLSGGQTRIIDIATILTLGDLQSNIHHIKINILIFDEVFDSLDEENIGFVSKVLNKLKVGRSIYLISHRHEDQLEADEVLAMA